MGVAPELDLQLLEPLRDVGVVGGHPRGERIGGGAGAACVEGGDEGVPTRTRRQPHPLAPVHLDRLLADAQEDRQPVGPLREEVGEPERPAPEVPFLPLPGADAQGDLERLAPLRLVGQEDFAVLVEELLAGLPVHEDLPLAVEADLQEERRPGHVLRDPDVAAEPEDPLGAAPGVGSRVDRLPRRVVGVRLGERAGPLLHLPARQGEARRQEQGGGGAAGDERRGEDVDLFLGGEDDRLRRAPLVEAKEHEVEAAGPVLLLPAFVPVERIGGRDLVRVGDVHEHVVELVGPGDPVVGLQGQGGFIAVIFDFEDGEGLLPVLRHRPVVGRHEEDEPGRRSAVGERDPLSLAPDMVGAGLRLHVEGDPERREVARSKRLDGKRPPLAVKVGALFACGPQSIGIESRCEIHRTVRGILGVGDRRPGNPQPATTNHQQTANLQHPTVLLWGLDVGNLLVVGRWVLVVPHGWFLLPPLPPAPASCRLLTCCSYPRQRSESGSPSERIPP